MNTMKPLRVKMTHQMQLQRLAPKTQDASIAAVAGLAKFSWCSPDQLSPEQIRAYLHPLLVERHLAWSSCNQVACGLKFFYTKTLGWDALHLNLPPRTGRSQLPRVLSVEALQRLFTHAKYPKHRALLRTTYAAGLRVSAVVHLHLTDIDSDRMLIRVNQGKGRKDRYTLLSARLLAELRAYWKLYRPSSWLFTGQDPTMPLPIGTAQKISYHAQRAAGITHGKGIHTLRHCFATHLLEAGVDLRTIQRRALYPSWSAMMDTTLFVVKRRLERLFTTHTMALCPGDPSDDVVEHPLEREFSDRMSSGMLYRRLLRHYVVEHSLEEGSTTESSPASLCDLLRRHCVVEHGN